MDQQVSGAEEAVRGKTGLVVVEFRRAIMMYLPSFFFSFLKVLTVFLFAILKETMREYIQQHPELNMTQDDIVKSTLTKAERHLKDKSDGRPDKPPPWVTAANTKTTAGTSAWCWLNDLFKYNVSFSYSFRNGYSMFCAELMSNMKDVPSTERMVMCSQRWKLLKQSDKDGYQKRCEQVSSESASHRIKKNFKKLINLG